MFIAGFVILTVGIIVSHLGMLGFWRKNFSAEFESALFMATMFSYGVGSTLIIVGAFT